MKMLTVSALLCATVFLTRASPLPHPDKPSATPPMTPPPSTTPPMTSPPMTSPPSTTPPMTSPPSTTPPMTSPPSTTPPMTSPPSTTPPMTSPPSTTPPMTSPPSTTPPVTSPPTTTPPMTSPPSTTPPMTSPPTTTPPVTPPPTTTPPLTPLCTPSSTTPPVTPPPTSTPPVTPPPTSTPPVTPPPTSTPPTTEEILPTTELYITFTDIDPWAVTLPPTFPEMSSPVPTDEFGPNGWRPSCPPDWTEQGFRCVRFVPDKMTWAEAEENCGSLGGSLISVFETEHFSDIKELIRTAGPVWVGGSKAPEGSSWSWSDYMSPSSFPNFCSEGNSMTNCLQASFKEDGQGCLEAVMCEAKLPSVCSIFIM